MGLESYLERRRVTAERTIETVDKKLAQMAMVDQLQLFEMQPDENATVGNSMSVVSMLIEDPRAA